MTERLVQLILLLIELGSFFTVLAFLANRGTSRFDLGHSLKNSWANILFWFFDGLFVAPVIAVPAIYLAIHLPHVQFDCHPVIFSVGAVIIGDFIGYWRHRLQHTSWFWPSHAVHHSDRHVTWLTLVRMHPLDRLSTATIDALLLALLGFPPFAVLANGMIRNWYGHFIHAELPWDFGKVGVGLISPLAHRRHHSRKHPGRNFATMFTLWDRIFRTYSMPNGESELLGLEEPPRNFWGEMLRPLQPSSYRSAMPDPLYQDAHQ